MQCIGLVRMYCFNRFKSNYEALAVFPTSGCAAQDRFVGVGRNKLTETGLSSAFTFWNSLQSMVQGPTVDQEK